MTGVGAIASSYAPGGLTVVAEDTFSRANSTTLGNTEVGGFAWTEHSGNLEIVSNAMEAVFVNAVNNVATFNSGVADSTVTANLRTATADNRTDIELAFRAQDANNYWMVAVFDGNGGADNGIVLRYISGGAYTTIGTYGAGTVAMNTTYQIKVVAVGTSIEVFVDGVSRLSTTSSVMQANTRVGARFYTNTLYDNGTSGLLDIKVEA